ncbi:FmdB family zinc ribbon protein [Arthrobacter ruber]|uniref:FmdB family zinc ribbon protein n=1 Tax=Arthrobacter ruber TaxID=1258893 RepID=UPI000CF50637|nr:FmdB family zinc ribbon protein [Arthrobacter ruber]
MPMYAYACKDCGHAFDIQQSFSDDSLTECPACGGSLRKKFNSVGVVFKGSGFYRNDSRSTTTSTDAGSPSTSSTTAAGTGSPGTVGAASGSSAGTSAPSPASGTAAAS